VTTERTYSENNDWQEPVVEQLSVSEISTLPATADVPLVDVQTPDEKLSPGETRAEAVGNETLAPIISTPLPLQEAELPSQSSEDQHNHTQQDQPSDGTAAPFHTPTVAIDEPISSENGSSSVPENEIVRPFTDFIEEFRQAEVRFNVLLNEYEETSFNSRAAGGEDFQVPAALVENAADQSGEASSADLPIAAQQRNQDESNAEGQPVVPSLPEEITPGLTQPSLSAERPVSPLLRPATRIRLPRHGRHRMGEVVQATELPLAEAAAPVAEPVVEEIPSTLEAPVVEEQPARPARRYRFDRPGSANGAKNFAQPASSHASEVKERPSAAPAPHSENNGTGLVPVPAVSEVSEPVVSIEKAVAQEPVQASIEVKTSLAPVTERRRRSSHQERLREKEPVVSSPVIPVPVPEVEVIASAAELAQGSVQDVPVEDLPPLEYSELQAANSRRRRRRRAGSASIGATNGLAPAKPVLPELVPQVAPVALPKILPPVPSPMPINSVAPVPQGNAAAASYNIVSGYTVSQMNQGNDMTGPFMGPEPSPARGSTFSSPSLRPVRNEALRNVSTQIKQPGDPLMSSASVNYLANTVSQAIQTQTDRMVVELRRANQSPTNISVSLPPFPSNERVGVFVDVANLLYSARTLRMTVDFGKLLDFLRGNRRLVRAQAYCPTSPQPSDEQMFLQAVKGLGYRITTKNYKTFSSGAKKADLDLDLCMDVVRLVDGRAVDCVVLVSGDSDFMPMLDYCSDHGVRVEVAAFDESMSATLRQSCDLFVNLSMLEEIRA
jgi:uncharacterized LabA/DUF88 family protein